MTIIKTNIIPNKPILIGEQKTLNYKAICIFAAIGFFLDDDTYFKEQKVLKSATNYEIDEISRKVVSETPYFKWHYLPVERPLSQIVKEFADLFETIIKEQVGDKTVILPLSGGLDSRTQAAALFHLGNKVSSYSYAFTNGHNETAYSNKIAEACGFSFKDWKIPYSYLWNTIEELATINQCYSEFTHPRQMAFVEEYSNLGEIFNLGHWGDVLFDDMGVADDMATKEQVKIIIKKIVKKGGFELAESLWESWGLEGDFKGYLYNRIHKLLMDIDIKESANAQVRAFKSLYWATRWTNTNLSVFENVRPISVPYFDNRMCEFICSIPEKYLSGRQIQIEYLKYRMPALAKITWQDHRPFNLYTYKWNRAPFNLPYKIFNKIKRIITPKNYIQRNWELQFLGDYNDDQLQKWLFENNDFHSLVQPAIVSDFYKKFKTQDQVYFSHSISMLLTLSLFSKKP